MLSRNIASAIVFVALLTYCHFHGLSFWVGFGLFFSFLGVVDS